MAKERKRSLKVTFIVFIAWFFILLPTIRTFISESKSQKLDFTHYIETEAELQFLIEREFADFPEQFYTIDSNWDSEQIIWKSQWHIFEPHLNHSVSEMDNLIIDIRSDGSKKKKKSGVTADQYWAEVYRQLSSMNYERIENLSRAFFWFKEKNEMSDRELLEMLIDYIQQIPYEIPENKYGLYTPSEILYLNAGDCDSKSVFAGMLLQRLGYDVAIFYSNEYSHAMLGINVPSTGYYKELDGKNYYFTEMTATGWQIGEIPSDCSDPDNWYISSL